MYNFLSGTFAQVLMYIFMTQDAVKESCAANLNFYSNSPERDLYYLNETTTLIIPPVHNFITITTVKNV